MERERESIYYIQAESSSLTSVTFIRRISRFICLMRLTAILGADEIYFSFSGVDISVKSKPRAPWRPGLEGRNPAIFILNEGCRDVILGAADAIVPFPFLF